jgi:hypothetical protein
MARAVAYLAQVVKTLEAYASVAAPGAASPMAGLKSGPGDGEESGS